MSDQLVKNDSKGYGYKYASLSDIAKQGYKIPRMKTSTENGKEYIYCYDAETKEWVRGAEVVLIESKSMNRAQLYGSALTYARRYSVQLFLGLACDDDVEIENTTKAGDNKGDRPITKAEYDLFETKYGVIEASRIVKEKGYTRKSQLMYSEWVELMSDEINHN